MSTNREVQAKLKANLNEKHSQAEAYRSFLKDVCSAHSHIGGSSASSQLGESPERSEEADAGGESPERSELRKLERRATQRWKQVCADVRTNAQEVEKLRQDL